MAFYRRLKKFFKEVLVEKLQKNVKISETYPIMIIHLYCISTVTSSPREVIKIAGSSKQALGEFSKVFKKISILTSKWNYTLHKAIQLASSIIREPKTHNFFQRLSYSVNMGVDLESFMKIEYEKMLETSSAEFDRAIEKTKRYIEAYSALLTATSFLSVSMLLISIIYGMNSEKLLTYSTILISGTLASIVFLMARTLPRDPVIHREKPRPLALFTIEKTIKILTVSSLTASIILMITLKSSGNQLLGEYSPTFIPLVMAGLPLLAVSWIGRKYVKNVEKMDENYPSFIKSLGDALSATNSLKQASKILEVNDYGSINKLLRNLRKRVELGFEYNKALNMFGVESLSQLILKTVRIIADSVFYGARVEVYSKTVYDYVIRQLLDRKKRRQVAGSLKGLVIPLQATMIAVSALITVLAKIMYRFTILIREWFPIFSILPPTQVQTYFYILILIVALLSSAAIYFVEGDSAFTYTYFLGLLLSMSGLIYMAVSMASDTLFQMFLKFEEGMEDIVGGIR